VQAAIDALGRLNHDRRDPSIRLQLTGADLAGADLQRAQLTSIDLDYADLTDADLTESSLNKADAKQPISTRLELANGLRGVTH
jgi:uncharacterized protein YjbI with pentapeptide repeats